MSLDTLLSEAVSVSNEGIVMSRHIKQFLRGVGSAIEIAPAPRARHQLDGTDTERLRGDAERIGADMWRAFEQNQPNARKSRTRTS
jgi:hypothetical protein